MDRVGTEGFGEERSHIQVRGDFAGQVQQMLAARYSPGQVSGRLRVAHPDDPAMRVSHETIYQSIYVYPRGGLRRELTACLRSGRDLRRA
jgi:transposase, IS30 family